MIMNSVQASFQFVEDYYTADLAERNSPESKWFLFWLKEVKGDSVLSLGCGPNLFDDVSFFSNIPKELVGIDINENNIEFLKKSHNPELLNSKKNLENKNVTIQLFSDDIRFERKEWKEKFDTIYAMGVVGMFQKKELQELLKTIHFYLKPGGVFLDIDWTDCRLPEEKYEERKSFNWYDKNNLSVPAIGILIAAAGFEIKKHEVYSVPNPEEYGWGKIYGYSAVKQ